MDRQSLQQALIEAGCSQSQYSIGALGDDCECLIQHNNNWQVVYAERGFVRGVLFQSASEAEACAFLWERMQQRRHDHLVGFFTTHHEAYGCAQALEALGLTPRLDTIPYAHGQPRQRVFVQGTQIFIVQKHYSQLPLTSWPPLNPPGSAHGE